MNVIVLAGFLWLIPENLIENFTIIIYIRLCCLNMVGKGMYGMNVHKAVVENKETHSGITIHYVNQNYDEGKIIFQAKCEVFPEDTPEMVAQKSSRIGIPTFSSHYRAGAGPYKLTNVNYTAKTSEVG